MCVCGGGGGEGGALLLSPLIVCCDPLLLGSMVGEIGGRSEQSSPAEVGHMQPDTQISTLCRR